MLFHVDKNGFACRVFKLSAEIEAAVNSGIGGLLISSSDIKDFQTATKHAYYLTATTGKSYIAIDRGQNTLPQFDIIELMSIGDKVSYGFNGDYYPDGEIVKISKTFQITTSTGNVYRRHKNTASWVKTGGTWCLVSGHRSELNPSF